jgi:hypothetical protein
VAAQVCDAFAGERGAEWLARLRAVGGAGHVGEQRGEAAFAFGEFGGALCDLGFDARGAGEQRVDE